MVNWAEAKEGRLDSITAAIATTMALILSFMMVETRAVVNNNEWMKCVNNINVARRVKSFRERKFLKEIRFMKGKGIYMRRAA